MLRRYARLIAFGNGGLHALYDKTDGFYRRQLILTTKDKVDGREDDPYLIDKLRKERDGIFLWALEGLQRLVSNNYVFTESVDAKQNLVDAQEEGNNILAFMKSEGYLQFEIGKKISSTDFYNIYVSWCEDNLEKPRASAGFLHCIKENQKIFMMRNVLVIVEAFTMYAKRSLRRLPAKHRLTDIGKISAHAAQPDIYGAV